MLDPKNHEQLDVADAERRKKEMREKISIAAVATVIVVVSSVIIANWSHVRQARHDWQTLRHRSESPQ